MEGWIKIYRKITDDPLYLSEKFTRMSAWIDLLLIANHKDGFFYLRGNKVVIKRGEIGQSSRNLAARWRWSRDKVSRFMRELETDGKISPQKNNITTLISICNYDKYQDTEPQTDRRPSHRQGTNKNVKNVKNVKNKEKEMGEIGNFANPDSTDTEIPVNPKTEKEKGSAEKEKSEIPIKPPSANFVKFQQWILDNASQVSKFKEPFTEAEFKRIKADFDLPTIQITLECMHNWKPLLTKNISANLTFRKWAAMDKQEKTIRHGKSTTTPPNDAELAKAVSEGLARARTRQEWE